jgi:hypothetical protein
MSGLALSSRTHRPLVLAATLFVAVVWFVVASPAANAATKPCWERVIDDWVDNGTFDSAYPPACLQAALKHVPEDIRAYSDFEERLKQARQEAFRARLLQGTSSASDDEPSSSSGPRIKQDEPDVKPAGENDGPIPQALRTGTNDASSIPLPLIILAALALVLMAAGAAGFAHRKFRARKLRP